MIAQLGEGVNHGRQHRVAQASQNLGLTLERDAPLPTIWKELLEGHRIAKPQVIRLVDGTHAALSNQTDDTVALVDDGVRREHTVWFYLVPLIGGSSHP